MLIELDNWGKEVLHCTSDYIIKPTYTIVDHKAYISVDTLFQTIADLTDELDRLYEVIKNYDKEINVYFKGRDLITLNEEEVEYIKRADELTQEDSGVKDNCIEKEILIENIKQLVKQNEEQQEELEDYKENYKPIGNESGWSLAHTYQREMENQREFLEEKGLWEEYKEKHWKVGK